MGGCMIKHGQSLPKAIAQSSAEAELYAAIRVLSEAKGAKSLGALGRPEVRPTGFSPEHAHWGLALGTLEEAGL